MLLIMTTIFAFIFGAIIGSFLNVVVYRLPRQESVVTPRSHCPSCNSAIAWYDNIPILSWLFLGGSCRHCDVNISPKYLFVEAIMGIFSAMLWLKLASSSLTQDPTLQHTNMVRLIIMQSAYFTFTSLMVTIALIDLKHLIVPHVLAIPGIILGVATAFLVSTLYRPLELLQMWPPITPEVSLMGAFGGAFSVLMVFLLYFSARGIAGMGGGDVTLMAMVGAWLGWPALIFVFFAASIQGLIGAGVSKVFGLGMVYDAHEVFEHEGALNIDAPKTPEEPVPLKDNLDPCDAGSFEHQEHHQPEDTNDEEEVGGRITVTQDDQDSTHREKEQEEQEEQEDTHQLAAIPFGPFIVLAALEYFFFGHLVPATWSMIHFY